MTVRDLAAYFGVPRRELYLLAAHRESTGFPVKKISGNWVADLCEVKDWMVACEEAGIKPLELAKRLQSLRRKSNQQNRKAGSTPGRSSKRRR